MDGTISNVPPRSKKTTTKKNWRCKRSVEGLEMREGSIERSCLGDRVPRPFIKLNDEFAPKSLLKKQKRNWVLVFGSEPTCFSSIPD